MQLLGSLMELVRSRMRKVAPAPSLKPKKALRIAPGIAMEGRRKICDKYMFKVTCMLKPVHEAAVSSVCWSHDNQKAVTTSVDGSMAIWDMRGDNKVLHKQLKKREPLCHVHKAHEKAVIQAVWSPSDRHIATCGSDTTVRLWEASGRKLCVLTGHLSSVLGVAWSPDGRFLASGCNEGIVMIWDAEHVLGMAIQQKLFRNCVELIDVAPRTASGHTGAIIRLCFSPAGDELLTASQDTSLRGWKIAQGKSSRVGGNKPYTMLLHKYIGHTDAVLGCAYDSKGKRICSSSHDQTVRIWARSSGVCLHVCVGHRAIVYDCAWFVNDLAEEAIVSCDHSRRLIVWDGDGGRLGKTRTRHRGWTLCVSPCNQLQKVTKGNVSTEPLRLLTASGDRTVMYSQPMHFEELFDFDDQVVVFKEWVRKKTDPDDGSAGCCVLS